MGDTGFVRFPASLDPSAEEFRPTSSTYPYTSPNPLPLVPPHVFYSYPPYTPALAPPLLQPAFVRPDPPTLPPPLPPPSTIPTHALLLSSVPTHVSESMIRRELEVFGDVRAVQMERVRDGIVTVHFYDLRQARAALKEVQEQHMQQQCRLRKHFDALTLLSSPNNNLYAHNSNYLTPPLPPPARGLISGRAVWAQYTFPAAAGLPDGYNQGTIVVFNLDSDVSTGSLKEIFEAFGCVKELRETPLKRNQRFVEFYDTRDAAKALANMNGKEIQGKQVVVEFSRPGGGHKNNYNCHKPNKFNPITTILPPQRPPPLLLNRKYRAGQLPLPPAPPHCFNSLKSGSRKDGGSGIQEGVSNGVNSFKGFPKKSGKTMNKQQPPEQVTRNGGSGGGNSGLRCKQWKGSKQMREKYDTRFLIKEDEIIAESSCRDSRTTVMIKNIPNKYSQKLLLNMLDSHCIHFNEQIDDGDDQPLSSYDFVYLPIDFMNKCNVGYGFVNMTSPEATWRLYKAFHLQNWEVFNSKKICEVSYARLQGLEALKEHFKNSKFPCEADEYMPVVFSPPRDGRRSLSEPTPIVGRTISGSGNSGVISLSSEEDLDLTEDGGGSCNNYMLREGNTSDTTASASSRSRSHSHSHSLSHSRSSSRSSLNGGGSGDD